MLEADLGVVLFSRGRHGANLTPVGARVVGHAQQMLQLADIGFVERPMGDEFETWELLRDEFVALFPPNFEQTGSTLSWEQLSTYPLVMTSDCDKFNEGVYAHCSAFGTTLHIAYQVKSDSTIVSMVARGLAATIIPRLAAEPNLLVLLPACELY